MKKNKLERTIITRPPFDKRSSNPKKDYGIGSMLIWYIVKGKKGAIQFQLNTGGYLRHVVQERANRGCLTYSNGKPNLGIIEGWDLGYHSPKPMYDGQTMVSDSCEVLGGKCYYDGTSLGADEPLRVFINDGEEGLWKFLEGIYHDRFEL